MVHRKLKEHPDKGLGERIRLARQAKGWSQTDLALAMGLKAERKTTISNWERDSNYPSNDNLTMLELLLGIEIVKRVYTDKGRRVLTTRICKICGGTFDVSYRKLFCSRECANQYKSETYRGENAFNFKGNKPYVHMSGYVLVHSPSHPTADKRGYVKEHQLVMEHKLGRLLEKGETVHHRNGIRSDNRPENLELWKGQHGNGTRVTEFLIDRLSKHIEFNQLDGTIQAIVYNAIRDIYE